MSDTKPETKTAFLGEIFRVTQTVQPDGRIFERAIRSPGTRIIIHNVAQNKILLSKELRTEINDYDYRLPGGKVRNLIAEWESIKDSTEIDTIIFEACKKEAREESGIEIHTLNHFTTSTSGGPTVSWDLQYFVTTDFSILPNQDLEPGEVIETNWFDIKDVIEICLSGQMQEGRSAAALLRYLHSIGKDLINTHICQI